MRFSLCIYVIALRTFGPLLSLVLIANIGSCWWLQSLPVSVAHSPQHYDSQNSPHSCVLLLHSLTHTVLRTKSKNTGSNWPHGIGIRALQQQEKQERRRSTRQH